MFEALIDRVERSDQLGAIAGRLKRSVEPLIGDGLVRDLLTGRWLGHPAHPALVIAPLTGWFSASLLDVVGGPAARRPAQRLVAAGTLAAGPAAMSGAADWLTTNRAEERVGTVHAALADSATLLYGLSWFLRIRRRDRAAIAVGLLGAGLAGATAFAGGHLSFRRGVGVTTVAHQSGPSDWTPVDVDGVVTSDRAIRGVVDGLPYAVVGRRDDGTPVVMESRCTHRGGPLHEGIVVDGCLECPWHGARFDLDTGAVRRGPASAPQPVYEVDDTGSELRIRRDEVGGLRSSVTTG